MMARLDGTAWTATQYCATATQYVVSSKALRPCPAAGLLTQPLRGVASRCRLLQVLKAHEDAAREMQRANELLRQAESGERTAGQFRAYPGLRHGMVEPV